MTGQTSLIKGKKILVANFVKEEFKDLSLKAVMETV